tara:strand:- start:75 stop:581 length:507 start_codon:yes stop_codon:yes gene_type:complete
MVRADDLPPGTHLLLKGFILPLNGIPVDVGFPAWISPKRKMQEGVVPRLNKLKGHMGNFKQSLRNVGVRIQQLRPSILSNTRNTPFVRKRGSFGDASIIKRRVQRAEVLTAGTGGPPKLDYGNQLRSATQAKPNTQNLLQFVSKEEKRTIRKISRKYDRPKRKGGYRL